MKEEREEMIDDYVKYRKIILNELIEGKEEEKDEAEDIRRLFESKLMDGGERDHFMPHFIKNEEKIDALTVSIDELEDIKNNGFSFPH